MSRWIDADALKENIPNTQPDMFENCRNCKLLDAEDIKTLIDDAPTIEAVECIECKYCSERGGHANCNGYLICTNFKRAVDEDSFCSWGERRER